MTIQVLGSGCPTCKKLFEQVKRLAEELKLQAEVEYISDVTKIIELGVMQSPVLAVDGKVLLTGGGHGDEEIKAMLKNI